MYRDFFIVALSSALIIFASIKCTRRCNAMLKKLDCISKYCTNKRILFYNIFQTACSYDNEFFNELVFISTFKKLFDPTQWFFLTEDTLIIKGYLTKRTNSFIYKKSSTISHLATNFLAKQKDDKYKIYGNKQFLPFVKKYNVKKFYISFLPQTYVRDSKFRTVFYLEVGYSKVSELMFDDLFETISKLDDCGDERFFELKKRYETSLGNEIMKLNIKERSEKIVEEREALGVGYKNKRARKAQKIIVKNK